MLESQSSNSRDIRKGIVQARRMFLRLKVLSAPIQTPRALTELSMNRHLNTLSVCPSVCVLVTNPITLFRLALPQQRFRVNFPDRFVSADNEYLILNLIKY